MSDVRVTRAELESLIAEPLAGLLDAIEETLQRNRIPVASLSAVATVGGGAAIPLVTQRLSEQLRAPVVTTPAAAARRRGRCRAAGRPRAGGRRADGYGADRTGGGRGRPDGPGRRGLGRRRRGTGRTESATDGAPSATFRALAWSQDDAPGGEPVPYSGEDYTFDHGADRRPPAGGVRATRKRATSPSPRRCPGTSGRRCCSGRPPRPRCWPSAAWRSR